ncbi:LysR family transcriptional regulator [Rehaibacterium terrae]|jgi:DNA-binding transcriptional LysR family regulator|uniref:DNA-binding transcriptional LysR family regulator n=1 Tax=Rehaibacterium terrae TaxID=1341696 RepID=A0A7W7XZP0_9GAMM|nr:LysR family transcriptional regulator [Rehaibacterium terrae]MBB5015429.1 DNA-binding transcriptional LysR family regulator [Rehaibacterium terrae]
MANTPRKRSQKSASKTESGRFYYKGSRLKPLQAFCQVARLGSVSRAAEALFLSQPAVSLQLKALESHYGVPLLERVGRRLSLTREGEALYDLVRPLLEGFESLDEAFRNSQQGLDGGEVNIAAGSSTLLHLLPATLAAFRRQRPEVRVHLHSVTGRAGLEKLRADEVDFAVGAMWEVPNDIDYAPLQRFDAMLITAPGHPLAKKANPTLEDLSPYGLILPPKQLSTWRMVTTAFEQRRLPYRVAIEVGGWEVIKQYVAQDLGIAIVSALCLTEADKGRLVARPMREYFPSRSYGVLVRKGKVLSSPARAFVDLIKPGLFQRKDWFEAGHSER